MYNDISVEHMLVSRRPQETIGFIVERLPVSDSQLITLTKV